METGKLQKEAKAKTTRLNWGRAFCSIDTERPRNYLKQNKSKPSINEITIEITDVIKS